MIFQVLIVDDEPHVVESISALLEQSDRYELELHSAYRAQQAIEIMKQGRIDLLLTDIQLPGMDGLALVREVKQLWPNCTSVILSAYSEFQYAYEAIAQGVAGYILKTEEERDILARLNTILGQIEENLNHREWTTPAPSAMADDPLRQSRFIKLLYDAQITADAAKEALGQLGFEFSGGVLAPMMVQSRPDAVIDRALLLTALERYLGDKLQCIACAPLEPHCFFLLLQLASGTEFLTSTLETVQASIHTTAGQELAFVLGESWRGRMPLNHSFEQLQKAAARLETGFEMCVMELEKSSTPGQVTVDFLKKYINEHINEELSLMQLSQITGYNASYLSRIFSAETHETLVKYIARKRMAAIRKLMQDPALSLEQIMTLTNFNSRSYFNSFVKKETGLSPKKYRAQVGVRGQEHGK